MDSGNRVLADHLRFNFLIADGSDLQIKKRDIFASLREFWHIVQIYIPRFISIGFGKGGENFGEAYPELKKRNIKFTAKKNKLTKLWRRLKAFNNLIWAKQRSFIAI